jgi:hypothetical protein
VPPKSAKPILQNVRLGDGLLSGTDLEVRIDRDIDFDLISAFILNGHSHLVRLHHEASILDAHRHMVHGEEPDLPFTRTSQWSQRPHVASRAYYRRILDSHFEPDEHMFIEDRMHSIVMQAQILDDELGWFQHRVCIYTEARPDGTIVWADVSIVRVAADGPGRNAWAFATVKDVSTRRLAESALRVSEDGVAWTSGGWAYGATVNYTDGSAFRFSRRERPHPVIDASGALIGISNGVQYGGPFGDAVFTLFQPIDA